MGSTGRGSAGGSVRRATANTGRRVQTGYTTRVNGPTGRRVEVYSRTREQANQVAEQARSGGSRTRTTRGRRRTR